MYYYFVGETIRFYVDDINYDVWFFNIWEDVFFCVKDSNIFCYDC